MNALIGGIDFGTSNSTVGIVENGTPRLVALEKGQVTLPSAIFYNFEDNRTYYGRHAISEYMENVDGRLMRALKSVLGTSLINTKTQVKARSMAFTDILGEFIGHLKSHLDHAQGGNVEHVVFGRPVYFVDGNETADQSAQDQLEAIAREQGFKEIAFQFEPIAAALNYEQSVKQEELALIADIGGGTSDFSIIRVSPDRAGALDRKGDILANTGVHIGGTDFDRLFSLAHVMPELGYQTLTKDGKRNLPVSYFIDLATWHRINLLYANKAKSDLREMRYEAARPELLDRMIDIVNEKQGHALAGCVEKAKVSLTDEAETNIALELSEEHLNIPVSQADLNHSIERAVVKIGDTVTKTLTDAGIKPSEIDTVFLTGGSTAIESVRQNILHLMPEVKVVEGDMFGSVGLGLALDASRKFK
ncbi:putative chaperone protein [Paenochrobactrum gallinarii]|uniref:Putative chaperone protein n=1 Tax=Paenochrobactrum gallinarii TaxID=643673 RepID=A0A841LZG7_9HYPH|nr:Hsp70 family protein [Paenochrobactrum gallinarii]MBB6261912.1 putative chaperone protein [Paenochrobactrum gallinarii]